MGLQALVWAVALAALDAGGAPLDAGTARDAGVVAAAAADAGSETPHCPVEAYKSPQSTRVEVLERSYQSWLDRMNLCEQEQRAQELRRSQRAYEESQAELAALDKRIKDDQEKRENERKAAEAERTKREAPLVAELNALDGYQTVKWGMPPAKVRALFPKATRHENRMQLRTAVAGFPASITFFFAQDKLKTALVSFERTNKVASNDELLVTLGKALAGKYGSPIEMHPALGEAVGWAGAKTEIVLRSSAASANFGSAAEIQYDSVELRGLVEDVASKAKKDL